MTDHNEKVDHLHINTGGKQLSEDELKEVQEFMKSDEFKRMIEKAEE
ncbi:TPA: hypothetical protein L4H46_006319 [Pseudomonas aeruginosa]|nr:hypothetical protein [Pseudomonas aeruginosa]